MAANKRIAMYLQWLTSLSKAIDYSYSEIVKLIYTIICLNITLIIIDFTLKPKLTILQYAAVHWKSQVLYM